MRRFIFPITTGRSGTVFLTNLLRANLPGAEVYHERLGYTEVGFDSPDASHFMQFNSIGNSPHVRTFWARKTARVAASSAETCAEVSHFLAKAGLVENLQPLAEVGEVHLIALTREIGRTLWSLTNRFDFANSGFTWLFYLDPRYPNTILNSDPFRQYGASGNALWYIHEMRIRAEYYAMLTKDTPNVHVHRIDLNELKTPEGASRLLSRLGFPRRPQDITVPPPANTTEKPFFGEDMRQSCENLVSRFQMDHAALAAQFIGEGRRLATPQRHH